MRGYFCIGFIDFMLKGKSFLDYTNSFSPDDYEKNDKIILKYFSISKQMKKLYSNICGKYRNIEKPEISYILEKMLVFSIICSKSKNEEELFKEEESIEVLKNYWFN